MKSAKHIKKGPEGVSAAKTSRPSDLGPKQLQWCRENLPYFQRCEEQALASKGESK